MQIPETPSSVVELDLMKRLDEYANGKASWTTDGLLPGEAAKQACRTLHTNLINLVKVLLAFILDRVTAREMEAFTMHDHVHGLKVAHLMWHILKPARQAQLTPPEIGILVVAAHLHDLGMGLSPEERAERLGPESDLWDKLEIQDSVRSAIEKLRAQIGDENASESVKRRATQQLFQAEEALLTQDTRERHATRARYQEILGLLSGFHLKDRTRIPDIEMTLSFDGESFRDKLIDVCVSHNEDADALVGNDERNLDRPRFPRIFPVGMCNADLHTVAATLRLADILDFDRERTPAVLFHYLLPTTLGGLDNRSVLEWSKHLAISNWHIDDNDIVFRGRSQSHVIHHAVVQFCSVIAEELKATHATFSPLGEQYWPFVLPLSVKADIHEEGYRYIPYKFELDDERVYSLLMGGAIYDNPLVAVRELVQNAVDACKLRDSLTRLYEEYEKPGTENRIFIRYEEPTAECPYPKLSVKDTGTGMDAYTLERYFLQVGRSYYNSSDFNQYRVQLRKKNLDFAPVSEFGIGFLSTFLLADHVEVETAMWESPRSDTVKRILKIDGPTRLIRLDEKRNEGVGRFKGTRITLFLASKTSSAGQQSPPSWEKIKEYLADTCQDLPYRLNLEYIGHGREIKENLDPLPMTVSVPAHLATAALRIPVDDRQFGLEGEIVIINPLEVEQIENTRASETELLLTDQSFESRSRIRSTLLRGGFTVGDVGIAEALPMSFVALRVGLLTLAGARLRLTWDRTKNGRYLKPNVARDRLSDNHHIEERVFQLWLTYLLENVDSLPAGLFFDWSYRGSVRRPWLEEFSGLTIYKLASQDWALQLIRRGLSETALKSWERGEGEPLWHNSYGLASELFDLVMPRVTEFEVKANGNYILPPQSNWRSTLENCQDYIRLPVNWDRFQRYERIIEDFLWFKDNHVLNLKHKERFASWTQEDLKRLLRLIRIATDRSFGIPSLTSSDFILFRRAVEVAGDLKIGSLDKSITLKSVRIMELPQ